MSNERISNAFFSVDANSRENCAANRVKETKKMWKLFYSSSNRWCIKCAPEYFVFHSNTIASMNMYKNCLSKGFAFFFKNYIELSERSFVSYSLIDINATYSILFSNMRDCVAMNCSTPRIIPSVHSVSRNVSFQDMRYSSGANERLSLYTTTTTDSRHSHNFRLRDVIACR